MTTIAEALRFVQGAVAKKSPVPILTHFLIRENRVRGYNGAITLSSPIPLSLDCKPLAEPFVKAINTCDETVQLSLTASGRLTVKAGKFRVHVDCSPDEFPIAEPSGESYEIPAGFVTKLREVEPLIAEDASRPWARSILVKDGCLLVTNNVALVQYYIGWSAPVPICISHLVVNELLRLKEDPTHCQVDNTSITFHYSGHRWLKASLVVDAWPDVERIFNRDSNPEPISPEFFPALETLTPFVSKLREVWFTEHGVTTSLAENEGAAVTIEGWHQSLGWYDIDILRMLNGIADAIDWSTYPSSVQFTGKEGCLRGALAGKKDGNYPPHEV